MELKHSIQVTLTPTMISDMFFNSSLEHYTRAATDNAMADGHYPCLTSDSEVRSALCDDAKEFLNLFCGELDNVTPGELADDFLNRL